MRVLLMGGVFRLTGAEIALIQPPPEVVLARGLAERGVHVETAPLEDLAKIVATRTYDLVHVHHLSKAAVLAGAVADVKPFVFTAHSMGLPRRHRERAGLRWVMRRADRVVCLSEAERTSRWEMSRRDERRFAVIPNAAALPEGSPRKRTWTEDRPLRLLFVGQLIPLKSVEPMIKALKVIPRARLDLVFHNDALHQAHAALARTIGVHDRIAFRGQLSGDALATAYRDADALVLPSVTEALPSVVTEALGSGLPVIASDVGGIREQLGGSGILLDPQDDSAVQRAITSLMSDFPLYAKRALRRAYEVRQVYANETMIESHLELYSNLVGD